MSVEEWNGDLKTAQQSRQQVLSILSALETKGLSNLCDRRDI